MGVSTVVARIETILDSIEGVNSTFGGRPRDVPPADLPGFIILTGDGTPDYEKYGSDMVGISRPYRIILLVKSWSLDTELAAEDLCRPFFDRVWMAFLMRPTLEHPKGQNPLDGVVNAQIGGDTGIINVQIANKAYAGIEWVLTVEEMYRITYA